MNYPFPPPRGYEEQLNQQVAGFLYYSLQMDASLLNQIHRDDPITFSSQAELVAHQDTPLPLYTDEGPDREIDWVVRDTDLLVGYESKYGDTLGEDQLRDELEKLRLNADDHEVKLVTITPHTTAPGVLNRLTDEPVHWLSWTTIPQRLQETDEADVTPEQIPILRMLQDLFQTENMQPFTGFDHQNKQQYRYFIRELRQQMADTELENRGKVHNWTTTKASPPGYRRLVPKYLDIPFVRESRDNDSDPVRESYLPVIVDTEDHHVHAGIAFNVRTVENHQTFVAEHSDELVEHADEYSLSLWASMNSFNQWKYPPAKTADPAEMRRWLASADEAAIKVNGTNYKKAFFGRSCEASDPLELVREAKAVLVKQYEQFLVDDTLYPWPTMGGRK